MNNKNAVLKVAVVVLTIIGLSYSSIVSAHVTVKPAQVGIGAFQTFTVSVPSEKPLATVQVRVIVPAGLDYVTPTVKPGWTIVKKAAGTTTTEISWIGGSIPEGQRDEFSFSAKVPSSETVLQWKAYQIYADGSVVAWDRDPSQTITDFSSFGPFSTTKIINDLSNSSSTQPSKIPAKLSFDPALLLSLLALILSLIALYNTRKNKDA